MVIKADITEFPMNVVELIALRTPGFVDSDIKVFKRSLRPTDPTQSVGIFPSTKISQPATHEFKAREPTLKTYMVVLQTLVHSTDEQNAISVHSILSQRLWRMLFRDNPLDAGLTSLSVTANNSIERFQRRGIALTRYVSNEIQGSFVQTSWIEFWFETETTEI